jgi:hypothetical protein
MGSDRAHMEEMRNAYRILVGKPNGKNHLEDLGIKEKTNKMILKEIRYTAHTP